MSPRGQYPRRLLFDFATFSNSGQNLSIHNPSKDNHNIEYLSKNQNFTNFKMTSSFIQRMYECDNESIDKHDEENNEFRDFS